MSQAPAPSARKKPRASVLHVPYWVREFALIRLATVICAGAFGIGISSVFASNWWLHDALDARQAAQQSRDAAYSRFIHVEGEKQDIRTFQPQFLALRSRGLIGEENRLDWVDQIRQIQEQRHLLPLSFEIAPQQPVKLEAQAPRSDYVLRASRMNLHMDLLHEGDLFNFFEDLRQRGYFAVQDCTLKRAQAAQNVANSPTVAADCQLNWLTLAPVAALNTTASKKGKR